MRDGVPGEHREYNVGDIVQRRKNESKLTVERLLKISEILEKPDYYFFETNPNNIYNQNFSDNAFGGHINNLYQENKETHARLAESYEASIKNLKEEIVFYVNL